jgi:hypothetical protein
MSYLSWLVVLGIAWLPLVLLLGQFLHAGGVWGPMDGED